MSMVHSFIDSFFQVIDSLIHQGHGFTAFSCRGLHFGLMEVDMCWRIRYLAGGESVKHHMQCTHGMGAEGTCAWPQAWLRK